MLNMLARLQPKGYAINGDRVSSRLFLRVSHHIYQWRICAFTVPENRACIARRAI